jgi:hypothetical protein
MTDKEALSITAKHNVTCKKMRPFEGASQTVEKVQLLLGFFVFMR